MPTRIAILGAGHAHLYLLEGLARTSVPGVEVSLVTPSRDKVYAPMLPGLISGQFEEKDAVIDLVRLADAASARFLQDEAVRIDPDRKLIRLASGGELGYDIACIGVGAPGRDLDIEGARDHSHRLTGLVELQRLLDHLGRTTRSAGVEPTRIIIVGDGLWGAELALVIRRRLDREGASRSVVTLAHSGPHLGGNRSGLHKRLTNALQAEDISILLGAAITQVYPDHLHLANGARVPFDLLIWATEPVAPGLQAGSGLPADGRGFLLVDEHLRSSGARNVFVTGGAAAFQGNPMSPMAGAPRLGEGPVLSANVLAAAQGQPLKQRYHPDKSTHNSEPGTWDMAQSGWFARWASRREQARHRKLVRRFQEIRRTPKQS